MLVYDITNEKSFDNIKNWIRNIEEVSVSMPALSAFNSSNSKAMGLVPMRLHELIKYIV